MKSPLPALLSLLLLLTCDLTAKAAPKLSLATVRGFPGATVNLPIVFSYGSNDLQTVVALQADITYAQNGLTSGAPSGGSALRNHSLLTSLPSGGTRRVVVYSSNNSAFTNGIIASLPFTLASGQAQNFTISLAHVILAYADGTEAPVNVISGGIAVTPVFVQADGNADFFLTILVNEPFSIQASSNLINWIELTNVIAPDPLFIHVDRDAHNFPYRFYRAVPASGAP